MTTGCLVAMLALLGGWAHADSSQQPTFRADTYVWSLDFGFRDFSSRWRGEPMTGLTSDLFTVTIDKSVTVPATVLAIAN